MLLYEYSRNAAGLPIPGTQRRFKLNANPRQIGQESVGLGVYLTSVIMYMGILCLLTLLMIYLTVDNSQQNGYTEKYTSFVNNVSCFNCTTEQTARLDPMCLLRYSCCLVHLCTQMHAMFLHAHRLSSNVWSNLPYQLSALINDSGHQFHCCGGSVMLLKPLIGTSCRSRQATAQRHGKSATL